MQTSIVLLKYSFKNVLKEGYDFGLQNFYDASIAIENIYNS